MWDLGGEVAQRRWVGTLCRRMGYCGDLMALTCRRRPGGGASVAGVPLSRDHCCATASAWKEFLLLGPLPTNRSARAKDQDVHLYSSYTLCDC